jgi:hypothetical protein
MMLLTSALMLEARPLARRLGLRAHEKAVYPVYQAKDLLLVVTGTGPLKAAAATGWAMARFPEIRHAVNIGFAGAGAEVADLYSWHLIHSIRDQASGHLLVPDILRRHPFSEKSLLTVPKIVQEPMDWSGLVDMEGSGFFEAARRFLAPDRIALLKWVSDPLSGCIDPVATEAAFARGLDPVIDFIRNWPSAEESPNEFAEDALLQEISEHVRLTRTQAEFIRKWTAGFLARGGDARLVHAVLPEQRPKTKEENRRVFSSLKDVLKN